VDIETNRRGSAAGGTEMERTAVEKEQPEQHPHGPRYCVNTEGTEHPWPRDTITTEEIAHLGGWDPAIGVIEIDEDNNERTLAPGEIVQLRPGRAFCRKVRFRRGLSPADRAAQEHMLLAQHYPAIEHRNGWFLIPSYPMPSAWGGSSIRVAFKRNDGHPAAPPYGIYVPSGIRVNGNKPTNYTEPAKEQPPFPGPWGILSWQPEEWRAAVEQVVGWNLLTWARSFARRFAELN
jgi:hypothetical protein